MQIGFRPQFSDYVEEGSKTHSIRAERKRKPRVGEACHCFTGLRTKKCRLLGRWRCVKVEDILIYERGDGTFAIVIDGVDLSIREKESLAWRDGFRNNGKRGAFKAMMVYWVATHGKKKDRWDRKIPGGVPLDFSGNVIHWDFHQPVAWTIERKQKGDTVKLSREENANDSH